MTGPELIEVSFLLVASFMAVVILVQRLKLAAQQDDIRQMKQCLNMYVAYHPELITQWRKQRQIELDWIDEVADSAEEVE